jgi:hypothetical protein
MMEDAPDVDEEEFPEHFYQPTEVHTHDAPASAKQGREKVTIQASSSATKRAIPLDSAVPLGNLDNTAPVAQAYQSESQKEMYSDDKTLPLARRPERKKKEEADLGSAMEGLDPRRMSPLAPRKKVTRPSGRSGREED